MKRVLALLGALAAVFALAAPASAADGIVIRNVDTSAYPVIRIATLVSGKTPDLSQFTLRENNQIVRDIEVLPVGKTQVPVGVVLAIDTSGSMAKNGAIDQAKAAAKQFVAQKQPNDQIAVVAFADTARLAVNFTSDAGELDAGIDALHAEGETALWDAIRTGSALFRDRPDLLSNMVVLSDGKDTVSTGTFDQAVGSALGEKTVVFAVGLKGGDFDPGPVRALADRTGGLYLETTDPTALSAAYGQIQQAIQNQYTISYTTKSTGNIDLSVGANGQVATVKAIPTNAKGVVNAPKLINPKDVPGPLKSGYTTWIIAALVILAAGLLTYALILVFVRERSSVERALDVYTTGPSDNGDVGEGGFVESPLLQRAVDATAKYAEQRGILQRVEEALERADLPLQASEALFFYLVGVVILSVLGFLVGGAFIGLVVLLLTVLIPPATLSFLASQRQRKFTSQLPDTLTLLAGTLRAGYSLLQGVEAVAQEVDDPMGRELRRVLAEARLGRPLEDALEDAAQRMASGDFEWAVMAIRIQREVGGNLAELLDTVADTMIQRERIRREVRALTAEGRMSAIVLGLLPVGLGVMMYGMNPTYMKPLFHTGTGQVLLIGAGVLALAGFYWMKKTIEIEV